jgi:excisionase family DNA binding protein
MAAYATPQLELASPASRRQSYRTDMTSGDDAVAGISILDALIDQLADRLAKRLRGPASHAPGPASNGDDEWFDSRHAAAYLGVHRDTLRKLAAERAIPCEQDGPNCKLYFRRSDLDVWCRSGGRPRHPRTTLQRIA